MWKSGHPAISADPSGKVTCNHYCKATDSERWTMEVHGDSLAFKGFHGKYLTSNPKGDVYNTESQVGDWELWTLVDLGDGIGIKSFHGKYLTDENGLVSARAECVSKCEKFIIVFDDESFTRDIFKEIGLAVASGFTVASLGFFAIPYLGFTASGVASHSIAATAQSTFYGPFTSGVFSVLQSLGATGAYATYGGAFGVATFATGASAAASDASSTAASPATAFDVAADLGYVPTDTHKAADTMETSEIAETADSAKTKQ